jgi:hypothetical protein
MTNLDKFNKGGNCKLQRGVLIFIVKLSMVQFEKGGSCKLQFPQVTFKMKELSSSGKHKGERCISIFTPNIFILIN